jgi:dihydropteroate synthase
VIVTPIPGRGVTAIRDALLSHGWEGEVCRDTALGIDAAAFHVTGLDGAAIEAMLMVAARLGLELVTGDDWIILAGAHSRIGAFARPWVQPEPVRELAIAIGMALPFHRPTAWTHARGSLSLATPVIIGVLNVTPDSFSDGARHETVDAALRHVDTLLEGGASVVDVGGESTRPDAVPIDARTEQQRVLPAISAIAARHPDLPISVDTVRADTARKAIEAGAAIINDVTAGRHDAAVLDVAVASGAGLVLSHSRGVLGQLASYDHAEYDGDVTGAVLRELAAAAAGAVRRGVGTDRIAVDPGFGFAKRPDQNFRLLDDLDAFIQLGFPVLAAVSRKRFLGVATDRAVDDRDRATAAACALAVERGAALVRVHDPAAVRDAVAVAHAIRRSRA